MPIDAEAVHEIAGQSQGMPRNAISLLRRIRDFAQVQAAGVITRDVAHGALTMLHQADYGVQRSSSTPRESISDEVKVFVWQRDCGGCAKCGSQERLEFDHIIPLAMGGSNTARNLQLLCESCNRLKGATI